LVDLAVGSPEGEGSEIVVEQCTSLMCPTNLEDLSGRCIRRRTHRADMMAETDCRHTAIDLR
jgi:hypothetical protein